MIKWLEPLIEDNSRARGRHLPYEITQHYLSRDNNERMSGVGFTVIRRFWKK